MAEPITFRRPPRVLPDLPSGEIEIPPPGTLPTAPTFNALQVLMPAGFAVLSMFATVGTALSQGTGNLLINGLMSSYMGANSLVQYITYRQQKKKYLADLHTRDTTYRAMLQRRRERLARLTTQQQVAMQQLDPGLAECFNRVQGLSSHLWERDARDPDFLMTRLGLGQRPFLMKVKAPSQEAALTFDPLIAEAEKLNNSVAAVTGVPITLPLQEVGLAGLVGPREATLMLARAIAMQLATHHSPEEVKLAAIFPPAQAEAWAWLRWLPHAWDDEHERSYLADTPERADRLLDFVYEALNRRNLRRGSDATQAAPALPHYVVFLADVDSTDEGNALYRTNPALSFLFKEGLSLGASSILLAKQTKDLPRECRGYVEVESDAARYTNTLASSVPVVVQPDSVSVASAEVFARSMAAIQLDKLAAPEEIPQAVPLLNLWAAQRIDDVDVAGLWRHNEPFTARSLAVPIGRQAGGEFCLLNLHDREDRAGKAGHGAHGLVAGTTGAGKSELLQSLVAALATNFSPRWVSFLLIDYKGGGMADAFKALPHLTGTITNLFSGNLSRRALIALNSEVLRRQSLFAAAGVNYIDDYQRKFASGNLATPIPRLIIVVDEFAELQKDQPEFMRQLVSTARIGRSLGVHLILATQKPSGVVSDQIWSNSRFKLCLRVESEGDSKEMLKRPDAGLLPANRPGRGYLQVGNNEIFTQFQSAFGGAAYEPDAAGAQTDDRVGVMQLDGLVYPPRTPSSQSKDKTALAASKQLDVLVAHIAEAAAHEQLPALPRIWLDPLPERLPLDALRPAGGWDGQTWQPSTGWLCPLVGLTDDPAKREQLPMRIDLGNEGHLAIYGMPGTGKTTLLQTLINELARQHPPSELHFYLLDFGSRLLTLFEKLPHVGSVILEDDDERLVRLFRFLRAELARRKELLLQAGVTKLSDYRMITGERVRDRIAPSDPIPSQESLPAIVIVCDNYPSLANKYADGDEMIIQLAREGAAAGIHLVLTANNPMNIKSRVSSNIALALAYQLPDRGDYSSVVGRTGGLEPAAVPGRGLVKLLPPLEFQTGLSVSGETEAERIMALRKLIGEMRTGWGEREGAKPIAVLPEALGLQELPLTSEVPVPLSVPLGLWTVDLSPAWVSLSEGPHFVIAGATQTGKTMLLQTWLIALAQRFTPQQARFYLCDFGQNSEGLEQLLPLPHVQGAPLADDDEKLNVLLADISTELTRRKQLTATERPNTALILAIDDLDALLKRIKNETKTKLEELLKLGRGLGLHLLVAGSDKTWGGYSLDAWAQAIRDQGNGFVLASGQSSALTLRLSSGESNQLVPVGQAYYAQRSRPRPRRLKLAQGVVGEWVNG